MTDLTLPLDSARSVMYDELCDEFDEQVIEDELQAALRDHLTELYDRREQLQAAQITDTSE